MQLMVCRESFMWQTGEVVHAGQVFYDSNPLVRKYGIFFRPVDFSEDGRMMVEQATAAPGEARLVKRAVPVPEPEPELAAVEPERSGRPWVTASKEDWLAYAASLGVETEGLTKMQLIDAVEAREAA